MPNLPQPSASTPEYAASTPMSAAQRGLLSAALILIYVVFAILLNSVGTVILQVINNFEVTKAQASVLEGFKDLPIAIVSFLVASWLPTLGYKRAMLIALALVTAMCVVVPLAPSFMITKLLFFVVGVSFALVKVSVYASIGLITRGPSQHASLLNSIEGCFMLGVLSGYWIFGAFVDSSQPQSLDWYRVYWVIAGLTSIAMLLVAIAPLKTPQHQQEQNQQEQTNTQAKTDKAASSLWEGYLDMFRLLLQPLVWVFIIAAFLYVLIEQGIGTWLPTFNQEILALPTDIAIQLASVFAASLAIGRLSAGLLLRFLHWRHFLTLCCVAMAGLILAALPMAEQAREASVTVTSWTDVPLAAWLFPCIGLFMAPIYPAINSVILSALPTQKHAHMTGLIVVFSALGGTSGSLLTGVLFGHFSDERAFYFVLVPLVIIVIAFWRLDRLLSENNTNATEEHLV